MIKPILFNSDMVRAILDGRKTVTRRVIKPQPKAYQSFMLGYCIDGNKRDIGKYGFGSHEHGGYLLYVRPPYQSGDILYVRETWNDDWCDHYIYRADGGNAREAGYSQEPKWRPSIHMPKAAARIWIKVTDVRVARLQNMRPVDVINEGAYEDCLECLDTYEESGAQCCYQQEDECSQCDSVMMEWERLWNSTIKKTDLTHYDWAANPWVWVIEFERCEKPVEESP